MGRYFFDVLVEPHRAEMTTAVARWRFLETARRLVALMALDLEMEPDEPWLGWMIDVRGAEEHEYFSKQVQVAPLGRKVVLQ